jgi:glutamine synthetase
LGIFSERELEARTEIYLEDYIKRVQIESRVIGDLALNHIIPTAISYQNKLIENAVGLKSLGLEDSLYNAAIKTIRAVGEHVNVIKQNVDDMVEARKKANKVEDTHERAHLYDEEVKAFFSTIRYHVDKLELLVDDKDWPLVKYRELLFIK